MCRSDKFSVFGKSAMHNATVTGRPFGGVAILCKEEPNLSYQEISTASDRFIAVGIYNAAGDLVHIVVSVYMPYFRQSDTNQHNDFVSTIDALQSFLDEYGSKAPIKFCGDFNTQLPRNAQTVV